MTIEDAAELRLQQPHVVRLESRPAGVEGRGEVTIRDLLRNALRMRPDRIVIGEVRGAEALDLLTALNTGHDGALSTVHANSPADALARLETLALMAGVGPAARGDRRAGAARDRPRRPARAARRRRPRRQRVAEVGGDGGARRCGRGGVTAAGGSAADRWSAPSPAACWRWRRARRCSPARRRRAGCGRRSSRCCGPAARATRPRAASGGGWRRSAALVAVARRLVPRRADGGAAAGGRRARRRRLGDLEPAPPLPRARSSARCRKSRPRSPTRSAPAARLRASLPAAAASSTARRRPSWRGSAPSSTSAPRPPRRSRPGGGGCARERVDAFAAALLSQRLAGGDLAGLLRRFASGAAERDRVAEDARSATAQARFTGLLVVAMPSGGALFAELLEPGFLAGLLGSTASAVLLAVAAALQLVGFVAIKRLSRVVE